MLVFTDLISPIYLIYERNNEHKKQTTKIFVRLSQDQKTGDYTSKYSSAVNRPLLKNGWLSYPYVYTIHGQGVMQGSVLLYGVA